MKFSRYAAAVSLAALTAAIAGSAMAATPLKLGGHVAPWVAKSAKVGVASNGQTVKLQAMLPFRKADELSALIARQATPGSADYEHYLTATQFRERFAPLAADATKVQDGLRALGFTVGSRPANNLYVNFTGTVGQVKAAFGVSQNLYSFKGKVVRANAEDPSVPASLSGLVKGIRGLEDTAQLIHPYHRTINDDVTGGASAMRSAARTRGASPAATLPVAANLPSAFCSTYYGDTVATLTTGVAPYGASIPWLVCGYTPQQVRKAYGSNTVSQDGTGVTVAIVDAYISPTMLQDANAYSANHRLPKLKEGRNFQTIYEGDISQTSNDETCDPQGWFGEISLDIDAVHGMAPGSKIIYSGGLSCETPDLDAAINAIVDGTQAQPGPLADIITNSYGYAGEPSPAEQDGDTQIFQQASAEGITMLFSSGDDGDLAYSYDYYAEASWPASSPLVTAVGGTSLALPESGRKQEWGWGTFRSSLTGVTVNDAHSVTDSGGGAFAYYSGAGGGPSFFQAQPDYQAGVVLNALSRFTYDYKGNKYSLGGTYRVTPDIAMVADPYTGVLYGESFTIAGDPTADAGCTPTSSTTEYCEGSIGGTSLASPLFAGTLALVTQSRRTNGVANIGQANARLYALRAGAPGSGAKPIADVQAPTSPNAVLRGYVNNLNAARLVTMNSTPGPFGPKCTTSYCNGQDSWTLQTKPGYDNVTGVGTPYVPALIAALGGAPTPD